MDGAAFYALTSLCPAWTGHRAAATWLSSTGPEDEGSILQALVNASTYLKWNRLERGGIALGLPSDGYGLLGVCNDSNAFAMAFRGEAFGYPLFRHAALNKEVGGILRGLPDELVRLGVSVVDDKPME